MQNRKIIKVTKRSIPGYILQPAGDHYKVRKVGTTRKQVKTDPRFARTRALGHEFGAAGKLAAAVCRLLFQDKDIRQAAPHLIAAISRCLPTDQETAHGQRTVFTADPIGLIGYDLNPAMAWEEATTLPCHLSPGKRENAGIFHYPAHKPTVSMSPPPGATHYRLLLSALMLWSVEELRHTGWKRSSRLPLKSMTVPAGALHLRTEPADAAQVWWIAGIEWYTGDKAIAGPFRIIHITDKKATCQRTTNAGS